MLAKVVDATRAAVGKAVRIASDAVKSALRPAPALGAAAIGVTGDMVKSRGELIAENALLRQQLIVLRRSVKRPKTQRSDRLLMIVLARLAPEWRDAIHLVQPDTLLGWHRSLFKMVWRRKSRPKRQPGQLGKATIAVIQRMATETGPGARSGSVESCCSSGSA